MPSSSALSQAFADVAGQGAEECEGGKLFFGSEMAGLDFPIEIRIREMQGRPPEF